MSEAYIGEIRTFAGNFAPTGWAICDGRLLPVASNTALFSILGTTYGGDGKTTFGLPNLQGVAPMHWGSGPGLTPRIPGDSGGSANVTLTSLELPAHTHAATGSLSSASALSPANAVLADAPLYADPPYPAMMNGASVEAAGGNQPHNNMQPSLALTFIIALVGVFPPRG